MSAADTVVGLVEAHERWDKVERAFRDRRKPSRQRRLGLFTVSHARPRFGGRPGVEHLDPLAAAAYLRLGPGGLR